MIYLEIKQGMFPPGVCAFTAKRHIGHIEDETGGTPDAHQNKNYRNKGQPFLRF